MGSCGEQCDVIEADVKQEIENDDTVKRRSKALEMVEVRKRKFTAEKSECLRRRIWKGPSVDDARAFARAITDITDYPTTHTSPLAPMIALGRSADEATDVTDVAKMLLTPGCCISRRDDGVIEISLRKAAVKQAANAKPAAGVEPAATESVASVCSSD